MTGLPRGQGTGRLERGTWEARNGRWLQRQVEIIEVGQENYMRLYPAGNGKPSKVSEEKKGFSEHRMALNGLDLKVGGPGRDSWTSPD